MLFLALLEALNFNFSKFEPFLKSQICQNSKLRVSEVVKMAIFEIQILPKLISHKIEWQKDSCIVDLNYTFLEFLEHSDWAALNFFIGYVSEKGLSLKMWIIEPPCVVL